MSFKTLMIIKCIVCFCFSVLLLFIPEILVNLLGAVYSTGTALTAREYGASLAGNFLMTWFARNAETSPIRWAIILNLFVYDAIGVIITLLVLLPGALNALGWGVVIVYLFFTIGFGYFLLKGKASPKTQAAKA